jgi:serine/threonine protein kinase
MLTGTYPFAGRNNKKLFKDISTGKLVFQPYMKVKHISVLKKILNRDPAKRPSVSKILQIIE